MLIIFLLVVFVWMILSLFIMYRLGFKKGFILGQAEAIRKTNAMIHDL